MPSNQINQAQTSNESGSTTNEKGSGNTRVKQRPQPRQPPQPIHNTLTMTGPIPAATASPSPPTKRSRKAPSPNSVLDRPAFVKALDEAGIVVKANQIDGFYQGLHREHYPPLGDFVEMYYRNEARVDVYDPTPQKNMVSRKKNKNRVQLSRVFLDFLADPNNGFVTVTSTVDSAKTSKDGSTTKLAVRLHDGHLVESVLMRYVSKDGSRASLCVSSQVGCAMGCTFCATATMGIRGNLTAGEILEQMVHANRILAKEMLENEKQAAGDHVDIASNGGESTKEGGTSNSNSNTSNNNNKEDKTKQGKKKKNLGFVRNVVFMGMGEPLNNYNNVIEACRGMLDRRRWNLGHGKVTISTVGVIPKMRALTRDLPEVSLALSLHAPNQEMRSKIVPTSTAYKIEGLIDALDNHMGNYLKKIYNGREFIEVERKKESTRRRAMIEYVMCELSMTCPQVVPENGVCVLLFSIVCGQNGFVIDTCAVDSPYACASFILFALSPWSFSNDCLWHVHLWLVSLLLIQSIHQSINHSCTLAYTHTHTHTHQ